MNDRCPGPRQARSREYPLESESQNLNLRVGVFGGEGDPQTSGALRNCRRADSRNEEAQLLEQAGGGERARIASQDDGQDGRWEVAAGLPGRQAVYQQSSVLEQAYPPPVALRAGGKPDTSQAG